MKPIYKIFHERDAAEFNKVYMERRNYHSSVPLGLYIKPIHQPDTYELYYVPTNKMISMISELHIISRKLNQAFKELPPVARNQFIIECIAEELYNTNELEGIKSNREEIVRSAKEIIFHNKKTKKRFESMIRSYHRLLGDFDFPKRPLDIRRIYDDITQGEIDPQELPDGDIFRKEAAYILKKSGTGKVVHIGITPESKIISLVEKWLDFMNRHSDIPNSGLTVSELSDIFGKSAVTIRKMIKDLLDLSLIIKRGERPAYFSIRDQYFEE